MYLCIHVSMYPCTHVSMHPCIIIFVLNSVWNAGNCDVYVLKKDLAKRGASPYVLDGEAGDMLKSSIDLKVELSDGQVARL